MQQAAQGTHQVSSNISDVQRGAGETRSASTQVIGAAQSLSGDSNRLKPGSEDFSTRSARHEHLISQPNLPRALFAADRRSISFTAAFMLGRYFLAANSGVIEDERKIRLRLPSTGRRPESRERSR